MPLAAYISDEFHRFVTANKHHGEQSFLDTCRSFGCICVLACQSIASMRHALAGMGAAHAGDQAVDILLTNTANKFLFRTSEPASLHLLDSLAPLVEGNRLTSVRPPAALSPGECYAAVGDGRFERRQLDMLADGQANERERELPHKSTGLSLVLHPTDNAASACPQAPRCAAEPRWRIRRYVKGRQQSRWALADAPRGWRRERPGPRCVRLK